MDKFLNIYHLPTLNQEQRNQNSTPISFSKIEAVTKFYQAYIKELMSILLTIFCKIEAEGEFPNSFYNDTISIILNKDPKENENC